MVARFARSPSKTVERYPLPVTVLCLSPCNTSLSVSMCRRDPEGIFVEPVTDDIAPGYSAIISNPMDLTTMATKVEASMYTSVQDFKVSGCGQRK